MPRRIAKLCVASRTGGLTSPITSNRLSHAVGTPADDLAGVGRKVSRRPSARDVIAQLEQRAHRVVGTPGGNTSNAPSLINLTTVLPARCTTSPMRLILIGGRRLQVIGLFGGACEAGESTNEIKQRRVVRRSGRSGWAPCYEACRQSPNGLAVQREVVAGP
jgi:hypothetical protein